MADDSDRTFQAADYVVFGLMLAISAGIGFFYAWKDKNDKKQNSDEFLLGGRNLSVINLYCTHMNFIRLLNFKLRYFLLQCLY